MIDEGFDVRYTPPDGRPRTLVFVPDTDDSDADQSDADDSDADGSAADQSDADEPDTDEPDTDDSNAGWLRAEFVWVSRTEDWRPVGTEPVTGVALFGADSAPAPARAHLEDPSVEDDDD